MTGNINTCDMKELFLCRVAAYKKIAHQDKIKREKARSFLLSTMTQSEQQYDFPLKEEFVRNVTQWGMPIISASRSDGTLNAIVYKINYKVGAVDKTLHEISFFSKDTNGEFKFTHKHNLTELYEKYCNTNSPSSKTNIRQLGDQILQRETKTVSDFSKEKQNILAQIEIMQRMLTSTGGVGIASNQCSEIDDPLKLTLVGVDYRNPEHVIKAVTRYPTALFPQLQVCLNPIITEASKEFVVFPEGCLSVQGRMRAQVKRPKSVKVKHQDADGVEHEKWYEDSDGRVFQHEMDHILNGVVYIQHIISELNQDQCRLLVEMIEKIITGQTTVNPFLSPLVVFERDQKGDIVFENEKAYECLQGINHDALLGLLNLLNQKVRLSKSFI